MILDLAGKSKFVIQIGEIQKGQKKLTKRKIPSERHQQLLQTAWAFWKF